MAQSAAIANPLVYRHEQPLFIIMLFISLIAWVLLVVATLGVALVYVLLGFIFYLFVQSAFISHIKGTGVRITPAQFPDLYARVTSCSEKLGLKAAPEAYLLHADGVFNALATRFLGRNFIVLYSDIVDALDERPESLNFYIGHELGHIRRGHLSWGPWLWPAGMLPLLGAAYSRAREYTCDLHGAVCCAAPEDGRRALAALAAGGSRWKTVNLDVYSGQAVGGFWMSFHELIGDYPWLVKRIARIQPTAGSRPVPGRHPLAWLLALFVPRLGAGGSVLIMVAFIGIMAAVAIPSYQDYVARAQVTEGLGLAEQAKACIEEFYGRTQSAPVGNADCGIAAPEELGGKFVESVTVGDHADITVLFRDTGVAAAIAGGTLLIQAQLDEQGRLVWDCSGGTVEDRFRPLACRGTTFSATP